MKHKIHFVVTLVFIVVLLAVVSFGQWNARKELVFADSLTEVAVTVDGSELTLSDMAFYIAYQENKIEETARIYNMEDTGEYWALHGGQMFLREEAKQTTIDMAIHDEIFYQMALAEGIELTEDECEHLANDQYDFWNDLEEEQQQALGVEQEVINESMRRIALAEKYQYLFAEMSGESFEAYTIGEPAYERLLEKHDYEVEDSVWDRVDFGGITVDH